MDCSQDLTSQSFTQCGVSFLVKSDCQTHTASCTEELSKRVKKSIYPRKCDKCSKIYKNKSTFFKHKNRCGKVKIVYPRACEICNKSYKLSSSYSKHKKTCNKSSGTGGYKSILNANISDCKLGLKDLHTCLYCGVSFSSKSSSQNHTSSCIGHLPKTCFECIFSECSRSFSTVKLLCRHLLAEHGNSYAKELTFESSSSFQEWLKSESMDTFKFKKFRGSRKYMGTVHHYYCCQFYKPTFGKPLGFRKNRKGTIPRDVNCPVRIYVTENEGIVKAFYFSHHNHEIRVQDICDNEI